MGNGFGMIPVGGSYLVQSVPAELNMDHTVVLQLAEVRHSSRVNFSKPCPQCSCHVWVKQSQQTYGMFDTKAI